MTERLCPWPTLLIKGQFAQRIKSTDKKNRKMMKMMMGNERKVASSSLLLLHPPPTTYRDSTSNLFQSTENRSLPRMVVGHFCRKELF